MTDFTTLGLSPKLQSTLARNELSVPTPIQARAIPLVLEGRDVLGLAQTGTGKTLAFGLPLLHELSGTRERAGTKGARALILAPTRELAIQIADSLRPFAKAERQFIVTAVGGQSIGGQARAMMRGTDVLVATPGRLIDLIERGAVRLDAVRHLVLDEADQMLDLGFIHALRRIAEMLPDERQTLLFSATMSPDMNRIASTFLRDPVRVEVSPPGRAADKIEQSVDFVERDAKPDRLREILRREPDATTLVFARTKHGAEKLMKGLVRDGFDAVSIHGNKSQNQRERAIKAFRAGRVRILVATDVAARGIDVPGVACVVNYDLPEVPDAYVHRIGRTARAGREGRAVALCAPDELALLRQIEKLLGHEVPTDEGERPAKPVRGPKNQPSSRRGGRRGAANTGRNSGRGHRHNDAQATEAQPNTKSGKSRSLGASSPARGDKGRDNAGRAKNARGPNKRSGEPRANERPTRAAGEQRNDAHVPKGRRSRRRPRPRSDAA